MATITRIQKRNGEVVNFEPEKIARAMEKAFQAVRGGAERDMLRELANQVMELVAREYGEAIPNVEGVQDIVERTIMQAGAFDVAKAYIVYRFEHAKEREEQKRELIEQQKLMVVKGDGRKEPFSLQKLEAAIRHAAWGIEDQIDIPAILNLCQLSVTDGMPSKEVGRALIMATRSFVEVDPAYSKLAARLLIRRSCRVAGKGVFDFANYDEEYRRLFKENLKHAVTVGKLDARMTEFDLEKMAQAVKPERDELLWYLGVQTLADRYLLQEPETSRPLETPQAFWMRVAMGMAIAEKDREARAIEFYEVISQLRYVPSTPTLFHSGTKSPQLSSCYLNTVADDLANIFKVYGDNAQLSKWSGGIGTDWTYLRGTNAMIKKVGVESQGVIPFLKIANDTTAAINRSGRRRGAACVYLECWHIDYEDFMELRKNTGDERRRTHDMNTSSWIPDLFMKRVREDGMWTFFSPDETPDLHDLYGRAFEKRYVEYERAAAEGKVRLTRATRARDLWKKMLGMLFETGHPWITFKDPSNVRSPQDHAGVIHNSNLCCIAADQRVVTDRGMLTVGELYKLGGTNKVVGLDGVYNASEMLLPRPNAPMVQINTKEGYTHKVTPDHKVWVKDRGWVEAQDLQEGDTLLIQQQEGLWGTEHDPELAYLMGLIAGDGTFGKNSVCIDIWKNDFSFIRSTTQAVHEVLSTNRELHTISTNEPQFSFNDEQGRARLASAPLARVLEKRGFNLETKTRVPELVWQGTRETVAEYLRGLYQADACIQSSRGITTIALASKELDLVRELQILWANFGVKTSINKMRDRKLQLMPNGRGGQKQYWSEPCYRLLITSVRGCQIAEQVVRLGVAKNSAAAEQYRQNLKKDGYVQKLYATFTHLTELPNEDAYCLMVDSDTHAWTVNGLITKNTEITLNTSTEETAVCNLGSVNLVNHIREGRLDENLLRETVETAVRMLDNVIDINFYPTVEAKTSNMRHRPIGLGIMGTQDAFYQLGISFDSEEAVNFADESMELVSYYAIAASAKLATERGTYESYKGSKWDRGIFPLDTLDLLEEERGIAIDVPRTARLNWDELKQYVKITGMRNSNCMAIAPTATISNISGCVPSIEPIYKNLYVKSNVSGDFTVLNRYLVEDLKRLGLWSQDMLEKIKFHGGSVQEIVEIPQLIREKYKETFEIDPRWLIRAAAVRGKWIDQSQSLNVFFHGTSGKELSDIYMYAWELGLKTTYYLRTLAASQVEKSTLDTAVHGATHTRKVGAAPEAMATPAASVKPVLPAPPPARKVVVAPQPVAAASATVVMVNGAPKKICSIIDPTCESCQ